MNKSNRIIIIISFLFFSIYTYAQLNTSSYRPDSANWNIKLLDTARDSSYLSEMGKNVILELNMVRTNPAKYADLYLQPMLPKFDDKVFDNDKEIKLMTEEGASAVIECITELKKQTALNILFPDNRLTQMAKYHAKLQGKTEQTGHNSPNGVTFSERLKLFKVKFNLSGENISYGYSNAREIVIQLIVDDGVPSRGHRRNVFGKFSKVGTAIGVHQKYTYMCVQDFSYINP